MRVTSKKKGEELCYYNNLEIIQHEKLHQCGDKKLPLSSYESEFFFIIMFPKERKFPLWAASNGRGSSQRKKRAREGKKENWAGGESEEN